MFIQNFSSLNKQEQIKVLNGLIDNLIALKLEEIRIKQKIDNTINDCKKFILDRNTIPSTEVLKELQLIAYQLIRDQI